MVCLSADAAVEGLVFGAGDLLSGVKAGQIVIDMTTIHPDTTRKEAAAFAEKGVRFQEAPVFGSKNEAANGGLWIVVGGERVLTHFALKLMLKDANLIAQFAQDLNVPIPASAATREVVKAAVNKGWDEENASAFIKQLEDQADVVVKKR